MNKTAEKNMTREQQIGMITLKNVMMLLADNAIDFQIVTRESDDGIITKEISRFIPINYVDSNGELFCEYVSEIVFVLYKNLNTSVRFFNIYDEILEVDCAKAFDAIGATYIK